LIDLAVYNELPASFIQWLDTCNHFCSSLVDRIVPGKPTAVKKQELEEELGYEDDLLIMSEWYRLWAIEGNEEVKNVLTFASADNGVIIEPDITRYRELKLRLLNGTHTATCGLAFLSGIQTVRDAMEQPWMFSFIRQVMINEIAEAIPYPIPAADALSFGRQVLDRFANPAIEHAWINITVQFTSKFRMRLLPVLREFVAKYGRLPDLMVTGLAGWFLFMKAGKQENGQYFGNRNGEWYPIQDEAAERLYTFWKRPDAPAQIGMILSDEQLWGENLCLYKGLPESVQYKLKQMLDIGVAKTIQSTETIKVDA
jgi:tagaturonate reductase